MPNRKPLITRPFLAPVAGPPIGGKGIGTRVSEISDDTEWAYVSARFDNVEVTAMDTDLDGLDDAGRWPTSALWLTGHPMIRMAMV